MSCASARGAREHISDRIRAAGRQAREDESRTAVDSSALSAAPPPVAASPSSPRCRQFLGPGAQIPQETGPVVPRFASSGFRSGFELFTDGSETDERSLPCERLLYRAAARKHHIPGSLENVQVRELVAKPLPFRGLAPTANA
ncbi:hypothetical protein A4U61_10425 [Streptomyces sp. H-KF8]|nr:hypothetical protein A4U61_10425 [Streptomyces sp. H-KF8]